jgi:hypothetical protein
MTSFGASWHWVTGNYREQDPTTIIWRGLYPFSTFNRLAVLLST